MRNLLYLLIFSFFFVSCSDSSIPTSPINTNDLETDGNYGDIQFFVMDQYGNPDPLPLAGAEVTIRDANWNVLFGPEYTDDFGNATVSITEEIPWGHYRGVAITYFNGIPQKFGSKDFYYDGRSQYKIIQCFPFEESGSDN